MGVALATCHGQTGFAYGVLRSEQLLDELQDSGVALEVTLGAGGSVLRSTDAAVHARLGCPTLSPSEREDAHQLRSLQVTAVGKDDSRLFTVLALDCDAVPLLGDALHGLWCDLPTGIASHSKGGAPGACEEVVSYVAPSPTVGTHRYGFFVFEQPRGTKLAEASRAELAAAAVPLSLVGKMRFNVQRFASEHSLELRALALLEVEPAAIPDPVQDALDAGFEIWSPFGPFPEFAKPAAMSTNARLCKDLKELLANRRPGTPATMGSRRRQKETF